jgi:heme-degrading monooxygenase HmoA
VFYRHTAGSSPLHADAVYETIRKIKEQFQHFLKLIIYAHAIPSNITSPCNIIYMKTNQNIEAPASTKQIFIDHFIVPQNAKPEFVERMNINRTFIKTLDGFIEDNVYERTDEKGNSIVVTVAVWQNEEAIKTAREAVQAEYKRQGFNMPEMLKRLDITMDRGIYERLEN